jgi:hypothetical protein
VALRDVRIAIQNAQNGVPLSSNSSGNTMNSDDSPNSNPETIINEADVENGDSLHKSDATGGMSFRASTSTNNNTKNEFQAPNHVAEEFKNAVERRRRISDDRSAIDLIIHF